MKNISNINVIWDDILVTFLESWYMFNDSFGVIVINLLDLLHAKFVHLEPNVNSLSISNGVNQLSPIHISKGNKFLESWFPYHECEVCFEIIGYIDCRPNII